MNMILNRQDAKVAMKGCFSSTQNLAFLASWRLISFCYGFLRQHKDSGNQKVLIIPAIILSHSFPGITAAAHN
ncbi:MAG: hypothetical protein ACYDBW_01390 [Sulfuricaulis sp.]